MSFDPALSTADRRRDLVILGSTGSVGTQAVDVVLRNPDRFRVVGLSASGTRLELLAEQALRLGVRAVAIARREAVDELRALLHAGPAAGAAVPEIVAGPDAAAQLASMDCHSVLNGITGSIGLAPTLAALRAGRVLALANKESLIAGGPLVKSVAMSGQIVPIDSEHTALFQGMMAGARSEVRKLVITASGGPFRGWTRDQLNGVTREQALRHPNWSMGPVITVNSATLVNKGLEVIEAHLLYDIPFDRIEVVVHPQSIVHSMVEFVDGSTIAQASPPDMRMPISLGLGWPDRVPNVAPGCDWTTAMTWEFFPLDNEAFPSVGLARHAGKQGGTMPAVFNAANEACVEEFLADRLRFSDIVRTVEAVVAEHENAGPGDGLTLDEILAAESWARIRALEIAGV